MPVSHTRLTGKLALILSALAFGTPSSFAQFYPLDQSETGEVKAVSEIEAIKALLDQARQANGNGRSDRVAEILAPISRYLNRYDNSDSNNPSRLMVQADYWLEMMNASWALGRDNDHLEESAAYLDTLKRLITALPANATRLRNRSREALNWAYIYKIDALTAMNQTDNAETLLDTFRDHIQSPGGSPIFNQQAARMTLIANTSLARIYHQKEDYQSSVVLNREVARNFLTAFEAGRTDTETLWDSVTACMDTAHDYRHLENAEQAAYWLEQAIPPSAALAEKEPEDINVRQSFLDIRKNLALLLTDIGKPERARELLRETYNTVSQWQSDLNRSSYLQDGIFWLSLADGLAADQAGDASSACYSLSEAETINRFFHLGFERKSQRRDWDAPYLDKADELLSSRSCR